MCAVPLGTAVARVRLRLELADIVRVHGDVYRRAPPRDSQRVALRRSRPAAPPSGRASGTCDRCGAGESPTTPVATATAKCQTLTERTVARGARCTAPPPHPVNKSSSAAFAQRPGGAIRASSTRSCSRGHRHRLAFGRDASPQRHDRCHRDPHVGAGLSQHLHLHCLVTGARPNWLAVDPRSLVIPDGPSAVDGAFVRNLAGLNAFDAGQLVGGDRSGYAPAFANFLRSATGRELDRVCQTPLAGPEQVLNYLGRYTHRVALSNDRLVDHRDSRVWFRWKDYADHDRVKVMTLEVEEFLRRFLLHVVPRGFMRIRHFGLLTNRTRRDTLARCRDLLGQPPPEDARPESVTALLYRLTGIDLSRCPVCGEGRMQVTAILHAAAPPDTS